MAFEYTDWFGSLKIIILEYVTLSDRFPILDRVLVKYRIFKYFSLESDDMRSNSLFQTLFIYVVDWYGNPFPFVTDFYDEIWCLKILNFLFYQCRLLCCLFLELFYERNLKMLNMRCIFSFWVGLGQWGVFGFVERFRLRLIEALIHRLLGLWSWLSFAMHIQIVRRQII